MTTTASLDTLLAPNTTRLAGTSKEQLREACQEFEALLMGQLFREMRNSVPDDGMLPRSEAEKTFQTLLDGEYARTMSRTASTGLAEMLYRQFQEGAPAR
jgi:flagellar protein FlgJ